MSPRKIFITGTAGFIGFHLARRLLDDGARVHGYDGFSDYYDLSLKRDRHAILSAEAGFSFTEGLLEDAEVLHAVAKTFSPDIIVHLAAQAGVQYSLQNPDAYMRSNVLGGYNVLETARRLRPRHLLMASTSSVYGASEDLPYSENQKTDRPLTLYAATKMSNEAMAHAYAHLWGVPTTLFRLFTVYGPWGRPDMAYFKFAEAMTEGRPIQVYNHGRMHRDFTYVADVAEALMRLITTIPPGPGETRRTVAGDSLSPVAPFRVVNVGNSDKVRLLDFIDAIEASLGVTAQRVMVQHQAGDVPATHSDSTLLRDLTGFTPQTDYRDGIARFADWFRDYKARQA
ncbi:MAG: NAD-dependent epimerase/dehydratase family protein [Pseudomonadota bacterium]